MSRRMSIIGALVLCALALGIVGAGSASAAGMTGVECKEVAAGTGHFETSRCETPEGSGGNWETVAAPLNELVEAEGESVGEVRLTATILFVNTEVSCKHMHATGVGKNVEEGGEMKAHGTQIVHHYTECEAGLREKVFKGEEACQVESVSGVPGNKGTIVTNALTAITAPEHRVIVKPEAGTGFAKFKILAESATAGRPCNLPASTIEVTGEVTGIANTTKHSHLTFEPATNGNGLKANGAVAQIHGTTTGWKKGESGRAFGGTTF